MIDYKGHALINPIFMSKIDIKFFFDDFKICQDERNVKEISRLVLYEREREREIERERGIEIERVCFVPLGKYHRPIVGPA